MNDYEKEVKKPIKVPEYIHRKVKEFAFKEHREMGEFTTEAIEFYLKHRTKIKKGAKE